MTKPIGWSDRCSYILKRLDKFDLHFQFTAGAPGESQQVEMRLSGLSEYAKTDFPVSGSSTISDWDLSWRDEATAVQGDAETLDELRALIRKN